MTKASAMLRSPEAPTEASRGRASGRPARLRARAAAIAGDDYRLLLVATVAAFAGGLLDLLPQTVEQDTWLALAAGRLVATHGVPHHVTLIAYAYGHVWIDQQWLAQLLMYWLDRLGGIALVGTVNVGLIVAGLAGAIVASIRLGASARSAVRVLPLAGLVVVLTSEVRTQPYAYPLFVATAYLLAADSRRPSNRVYWCLPLLVLWGNLHGSASLGAGLVALRGVTVAWERRRQLLKTAAAWRRPVALIVGPLLCLIVSPYGLSMASYYRATLLNPTFKAFVTEWQPVTSAPLLAVAFFALATAAVWSCGRHAGRTTLWERCALLVLAAGAIIAMRNVVWFGLAVLILLPGSIDASVRSRGLTPRSHRRLNVLLAGTLTILVAVVLVRTFVRSQASLEPAYPSAALTAVSSVTNAIPSTRVFADERFADWLLWRLPSLRGRVAYDASFELLSAKQLEQIYNFKYLTGLSWPQAGDGYRVVVLQPSATPDLLRSLRRQPGARVLYDHDDVEVLERPTG